MASVSEISDRYVTEIAAAVARQFAELDYSPPFQYGHPAAFELSRRLAAMAGA